MNNSKKNADIKIEMKKIIISPILFTNSPVFLENLAKPDKNFRSLQMHPRKSKGM
jgi:hypothetical protein